jgi:hypothetical protein
LLYKLGIEKEDFLMNKNHLLPALLFVLAACGAATSSAPASSSENPTPADWGRNTQLRLTTPFDQTKEGVEFDFTGKAGNQYLFRVEGGGAASELMATSTGDAQKFIDPVVQLNASQRAGINLFVIFARTSASIGTIVVRDWKYVDSVTPAAPEWRAEGGATAVMNGTAMTFTYTARTNFYDQNAQIAIVGFDGSNFFNLVVGADTTLSINELSERWKIK